MIAIEPVTETSPPAFIAAARDLFRSYAAFLREIAACHGFDFDRFDAEILDLPRPYTRNNGELLLASTDGSPATGCVAFRPVDLSTGPEICEIKRLFVLPEHRGKGIAAQLLLTALDHARLRGFRTVILDTEPSSMQPAQALYRKLGFTPYTPPHPHNPVTVTYLRKDLA